MDVSCTARDNTLLRSLFLYPPPPPPPLLSFSLTLSIYLSLSVSLSRSYSQVQGNSAYAFQYVCQTADDAARWTKDFPSEHKSRAEYSAHGA